MRTSNHLFFCRNLERNKLNGSIPAELIQKSNNGFLTLRSFSSHVMYIISFLSNLFTFFFLNSLKTCYVFSFNFDNLSLGGNLNLCDSSNCTTTKKKDDNNILVPIAASIGGLVVLLLVAAAVLVILKKKRQGNFISYPISRS